MSFMKNLIHYSFLLVLALALVACGEKPAGEKAETGEAAEAAAATPDEAQTMKVSTTDSQVLWVGSKPTGTHNGSIKLSNGQLGVDGDNLVSGEFELDMNSIAVIDLKAGEGKEDLEEHLKGLVDEKAAHFFNVRKYPTAKFVITKVEAIPAGGNATHNITGNLTLKDQTKSITFPANVAMVDGQISATTPSFKINRTEWGINFMSKSVFDDLKDKFIDDDIALSISLKAS